jgi:hypothetical protein
LVAQASAEGEDLRADFVGIHKLPRSLLELELRQPS